MSSITFGIIGFPGSNCDHDAHYVAGNILQQNARLIWHKEGSLGDVDVVILPGGFSYGDYLRCGAIARFSPIMKDVVRFAKSGGIVIGICNGFQILTEAGLLPGALLRNKSLQFICRTVPLRVETTSSRFTNQCKQGEVLHIPIAHGDGNYFADEETIRHLEDNGRVLFRYCDDDGNVTPEANPNGSINNIAGIMNEEGNVLGMMPHPERASDRVLRLTDGLKIFSSALNSFGIEAPAINLFEKERSVING
ncbi:MAG TPA: phosphoribosylformylglycinamidine synthase subunit PurQ [Bacteroidota bacterium]|nr:phosphoribosylformylglycinamidine synthase subunit PurQ [Bacteroidota bacterium]